MGTAEVSSAPMGAASLPASPTEEAASSAQGQAWAWWAPRWGAVSAPCEGDVSAARAGRAPSSLEAVSAGGAAWVSVAALASALRSGAGPSASASRSAPPRKEPAGNHAAQLDGLCRYGLSVSRGFSTAARNRDVRDAEWPASQSYAHRTPRHRTYKSHQQPESPRTHIQYRTA